VIGANRSRSQRGCSANPMMMPLRATREAEPVDLLVLRDLADEFGTVAAQADALAASRSSTTMRTLSIR
jgi:hypothetical protein